MCTILKTANINMYSDDAQTIVSINYVSPHYMKHTKITDAHT